MKKIFLYKKLDAGLMRKSPSSRGAMPFSGASAFSEEIIVKIIYRQEMSVFENAGGPSSNHS